MHKAWTVVAVLGLIAGTTDADPEPGAVSEPIPAPVTAPIAAPITAPIAAPATASPPMDRRMTEPACQCAVVDPGRPRKRAAMYVAAGGIALWAGALTVSLYGSGKYNEAVRRFYAGETGPDEANDARDLVRYYGTGLFVAGAVTLGIATYLHFTARSPEIVGQTAVVPTIGGDAVGLTVTGGF